MSRTMRVTGDSGVGVVFIIFCYLGEGYIGKKIL